jgi:endonuclease/exonuclease/phosphatase family metal-dependent hydrolase
MRFGSVEAKVSAGYHIQLAKDPSLTTMTAFPRRLATLAGFLLAFSAPVPAQPLSLLSFNVEHLMSPERFDRWQAFCRPRGWREARDAQRPEELTYCNALDGSDGRGRRLFAPVHDREAWQQKMTAVSALVREGDADIVLLQEVSDAQAARLVLGPGYRVAGSDEMWRSRSIAQNLAIGWRIARFAQPPRAELVEEVSQTGEDGRATRPGLALEVDLGDGRRLAVLNLHLKAGCRQGRLNEPTSRSPERAFRRQADCVILQRQVPAIERWADEKLRQGYGVIIAGDFNRDLLREIRDRLPARADGSDPALPAAPPRIASLVAELSDGSPPAARFALVRANRYPKRAECHRNIDSFLLSRNLEPWLTAPSRQLATLVLPFDEPVSLDKVRPSDHCPHLLHLPLEPARHLR